jgi:hypothetical protein
LVAGVRELGIDLLADEDLERWLNEAGFSTTTKRSMLGALLIVEKTRKRRCFQISTCRTYSKVLTLPAKALWFMGSVEAQSK